MPTLNKYVQDVVESYINIDIEEAFYVVNTQDIIDKHVNWLTKMPRVRPFYAVKCNSSPIVLEVLAGLGLGFDCASKIEIESVLNTGVHPNNIIFANPCKSINFIQYSNRVGVKMMTFDNEFELEKIAKYYPNAQTILRIKVDDSQSICKLGLKFGADLTKVPMLLQTAKELGLNVIGVSFHVGSGCGSAMAYSNAIADAKYAFDVGKTLGFEMNLLDIGGGYPGTNEAEVSFDEIAHCVNKALEVHFPKEDEINIIAEPGRYYVASAFVLCCQIIAKKTELLPDGHTKMMYYLNDGVYGSFNCVVVEHTDLRPLTILKKEDMKIRNPHISSIWGPTCDNFDLLKPDAILPEMQIGEWLLFKDMGAYSVSVATTFNGFEPPTIKYCVPEETLNILRNLPAWPRIANLLEFGNKRNSLSCGIYSTESQWQNFSTMHVH